jgi:host factor-I protein
MMQFNSSKDGSRKPAPNREINIQNQILNFVRKDRALITIFLVSGKKFVGQVLGFDRYTIHIRGRDYDQIVFKHAITNISVPRHIMQKLQGLNDEEFDSAPMMESDLPADGPQGDTSGEEGSY